MKIEVGKTYRARDGKRIKIVRRARAAFSQYPFFGVVLGSTGATLSFSVTGFVEDGDEEDPRDLIALDS